MNEKLELVQKFQVIISCIIITLGLIVVGLLFTSRMPKGDTITVTGSSSKIVKSDSAKLSFTIQARALSQKDAFNTIKSQTPIVMEYLASKDIKKENISTRAMNGYYNYKQNANGYSTNEVASYSANMDVEIKSDDVEKIKEISTDITSLVDKGITLNIYQPEYFYSDLASLKIDLLKEATKDAKQRATSMLSATNARVGKVKQMRMGVFQITSPDSTNVSDMGINDTSTIDKKITAVANVVFKVK